MKKSIKVAPKKRSRGRPPTGGRHPHVTVRMPQALIDEADAWAIANDTVRSDAIRRLVEIGLKANPLGRPNRTPGQKARAQELASKAIDKMEDPSAPSEEKAKRRRRLTKGPLEFREDRVDLPKAKAK